jgi:hypothetical protein
MGIVRVEALHAIGRSSSNTSGAFQYSEPVPALDVVTLGCGEGLREVGVRAQPLGLLAHHAGRLEPPDRATRAHAREPIQRRERLAVDDRKRLDHGRQTARTSMRDTHRSADYTLELALDRLTVRRIEIWGN